jgi:hypothetical protein
VSAPPPRPPPLRPFGLVLHHDGRWSHEGQPILNRRLREHFDRHVGFLAEERKFVVRLRHFRAEIEVEEAAFFVRSVDLAHGTVGLSDGSEEPLVLASLALSPRDDALLCRVKGDVAEGGLLARFDHGPHAELLQAVDAEEAGFSIVLAGQRQRFPDLEAAADRG